MILNFTISLVVALGAKYAGGLTTNEFMLNWMFMFVFLILSDIRTAVMK